MASALFGLSRAVAARSAVIPQAVVRARPALPVRAPAFVTGVRFYRGEDLERRMRTLLIHNVPWEMTLEEVEEELKMFRGFEKVEPIEEKTGSYRILFRDKADKVRARRMFLQIAWGGRAIIPVSEYTLSEPPSPSRALYISGVPRNATREQLDKFFEGALEGVERVKVPVSKQWTGYIGFAVMLFKTIEQATKAIELLHGKWIGDSKAFVDYSRVPPPPERKSRNKDRMLNPEKYEVPTGPSEKELKKREKAAEAREKRRMREEGMIRKYGSKAAGLGKMGLADASYRRALAQVQREEAAVHVRHTVKPDEAGVLARIGGAGVGQATTAKDKLEDFTSTSADAQRGAPKVYAQRPVPGAVVSETRGDLTGDELLAKVGEEQSERTQAMDEANNRIAAARARRARAAAQLATEADDADGDNETEPLKDEAAKSEEKSH